MRKSPKVFAIIACIVFALTICGTYAPLQSSVTIGGAGRITTPNNSVGYNIRIADFMGDILSPNFDSQSYANSWQQALNDLAAASPNGEITHVQIRTFWKIPSITDQASWNAPQPGAYDGSSQYYPNCQQGMVDYWKKWIFGSPTEPTYSPCAAERIHNAGFKLEFCFSTAWTGSGTIADSVPVFHNEFEAGYPAFNGETFLTNYMDNVLRPAVQFLASNPNFQNGDIFMLTFEMCYPYADFCWNHNTKWISMINEIRGLFEAAGKPDVLLTVDINMGWDDFGLGAKGLQVLINAGLAVNNPLSSTWQGLSGSAYLSALDFVSVSSWVPLLDSSQIPATWTEAHVDSLVVPAWHAAAKWDKAGTGHGSVAAVLGRDMPNDYWALSQALNIPVLTNTGWTNGHSILASSNPAAGGGGAYDQMAQKVAWMAQIRALGGDSRGWCCGQDFERYCENKASGTSVNTSWRNAPAQAAIIDEIRSILNP